MTKGAIANASERLRSTISMLPPWVSIQYPDPIREELLSENRRGNVLKQNGSFVSRADLETFVRTRTDLHAHYVSEIERTRRLSIGLAAGLLALACIIPVIAPAGRESISYWIGSALLLFSAGAIGYTRLKFSTSKRKLVAAKNTEDRRQ